MIAHPGSSLLLRRLAVAGGVVFVLLLGTVAIRASAEWTRTNAPLTETPVSPAMIEAGLATQQDRAAALADEVKAMGAEAAGIRAALAVAGDQVDADTSNAAEMRKELDAAKERLATLDSQIAEANARLAGIAGASVPGMSGGGTARGGYDDDDESEEHEDD